MGMKNVVNRKSIVVMAFWIVLPTFLASACFAQTCATSRQTRRVSLQITNRSIGDALSILATKAGVSIGFVEISTVREPSRRVSAKLVCATLEEALAQLLGQNQDYYWEIEDTIVKVWPRDSNLTVNQIADTRIQRLELSYVRLSELGMTIFDDVGVKEKLNSLGKKASGGVKYSGPTRDDPKIKTTIENETIRSVLNRLLSEGYATFWKLELDGPEDEFVQIVILGVVSG